MDAPVWKDSTFHGVEETNDGTISHVILTLAQIRYELFLEDGTKVHTEKRPVDQDALFLEFCMGDTHVIPGLSTAVASVSVGTTAEVTIPPLYAYGTAGLPPKIPPHAVLVYRLTLVSCVKSYT